MVMKNAIDQAAFRMATERAGVVRPFKLTVLVPVYNERHMVEVSLRRLLGINDALIAELEVIVVDDCSNDGSWEVLKRVAAEDGRVTLVRHDRNSGKGAAIRSAISRASGDICVIFDADLEYNPEDIAGLLVPFAYEGADAVFGSRYMAGAYKRALMHRHTMINKFLTFVSNCFTDLNLSDIETALKAVNTTLLKSIPIRSNDFRFEVEIVSKLAKRRARIFETPVRYVPRTYQEGKKIRPRDGLLALVAMLRFWLIDDLYKEDEYGWPHLVEVEKTTRFNFWLGEVLRPFVGDRVLELEAGIGTLTSQFIPREHYVASDRNPNYIHYLKSYSYGKPYLEIREADALGEDAFWGFDGFDTVIVVNLLAELDESAVLMNVRAALNSKGKALIAVPLGRRLYGSLDKALGRTRRYDRQEIECSLVEAGFKIERTFDFNRLCVPLWLLSSKLLRRKRLSKLELKILDTLIPVMKRVDKIWPWKGLSLVIIAEKP
jgi:glycosyltransferase involved in cell wall biosynthesis